MNNGRILLNIQEVCDYLGIGKTKARELLRGYNGFGVQIGNRGMPIRKNQMNGLTMRQCSINRTNVENIEVIRICQLKKQQEDDILEKYIYA